MRCIRCLAPDATSVARHGAVSGLQRLELGEADRFAGHVAAPLRRHLVLELDRGDPGAGGQQQTSSANQLVRQPHDDQVSVAVSLVAVSAMVGRSRRVAIERRTASTQPTATATEKMNH